MLAYCEGVSIGHISINETAWLNDIHIQHLVDLDKFITAKIAPTCTPKAGTGCRYLWSIHDDNNTRSFDLMNVCSL